MYTYIGEVVVSVNPYRSVDIYNDEYVEEYRGKEIYERPPHIFAVADSAYHDMRRLNKDSAIVITGTCGIGAVVYNCCITPFLQDIFAGLCRSKVHVLGTKSRFLVFNLIFQFKSVCF